LGEEEGISECHLGKNMKKKMEKQWKNVKEKRRKSKNNGKICI
jgi:hypothetical protein